MKALLQSADRAGICAVIFSGLPSYAETPLNISIGFTGTDHARINPINRKVSEERLGWFVDLANRVGGKFGRTVSFHQNTWKRILKEVASGTLGAATNSSYNKGRTEFGHYPTANEQRDTERVFSRYRYIAIVRKGEYAEILANGIVSGKKITRSAEPRSFLS